MVSDFRREYHMPGEQLAVLGAADFRWLLAGLSDRSRFRQAWTDAPKNLYDPADIEAVKAAARR